MTTETKPRFRCRSKDGRTNVWIITCPKCGYEFTPNTTMWARQGLQCPAFKCRAEMIADYNEEKVRLLNE